MAYEIRTPTTILITK